MEWTEEKIKSYVNEGWSLSWDKTNKKFKLQKRINGKVKSYTLPRKFNEFCKKLKEEIELFKKYNKEEIFKNIDENPLFDLHYGYGFKWDEIEKIYEKYCEEKSKNLDIRDIAKMAYYCYHLLKELGGVGLSDQNLISVNSIEEELYNLTYLVINALGKSKIKIKCPLCGEWTYLELKEDKYKIKKWVCKNCGKDPIKDTSWS